jgi:mRNA interferase RelE/StbE
VIRIIRKVEMIKDDPYKFLKKIRGDKSWKLRVGDYRILIDINFEKNVLEILKVGHRKNIYKGL